MIRLESIKKRRQEYLDSIRNYVEGVHEEKRDEFLFYSEQDIEYLLQRLERYEKALKDITDMYGVYGLHENYSYGMNEIAEEALKEDTI